jgi:hypothetical protein
MRGRHAVGPELVDRVEGSALARKRTRLVYETMLGHKRVKQACEELDISAQRFEGIRWDIVVASVGSAELKPAGRPRQETSTADAENARLRERVADLEAQLQAALIRAEMATTLPRIGGETRKKSQPRSQRAKPSSRRQSRPGT